MPRLVLGCLLLLNVAAMAHAQSGTAPWPSAGGESAPASPRHSPYVLPNTARAATWAQSEPAEPATSAFAASYDEPLPGRPAPQPALLPEAAPVVPNAVPVQPEAAPALPDAAPAARDTTPATLSPPPAPVPLNRRPTEAPLPLAARGSATHEQTASPGSLPSMVSLAGSLAVVLAIFFTLMWLMRRAAPVSAQPLPVEVVEVLGRAPLAGRQQMHLLRCGRKLLLVSVTPEGAETLTEITDPEEVDRLAGLCVQARPNSTTAAFRQVFHQWSGREGRHVS